MSNSGPPNFRSIHLGLWLGLGLTGSWVGQNPTQVPKLVTPSLSDNWGCVPFTTYYSYAETLVSFRDAYYINLMCNW